MSSPRTEVPRLYLCPESISKFTDPERYLCMFEAVGGFVIDRIRPFYSAFYRVIVNLHCCKLNIEAQNTETFREIRARV
ncbi:hypothetical protein I7I51_05244, partial [Histoplasma capsulatum]